MSNSKPLALRKCVACEGGVKPFTSAEAKAYLSDIPGWKLATKKPLKLSKEYKFKDFKEALKFVNGIGAIAEQEQHHPDLLIYSWNKVNVTTYTHAIKGLSENDFILAAKINRLKA